MKRHLPAFITTLLLSLAVTWALTSVIKTSRRSKPETLTPAAGNTGNPHKNSPARKEELRGPEQTVRQIARWDELASRPETLVAVDNEIRNLPMSAFPAICEAALELKDPDRHPVMRLLCIRWAEWNGLQALGWAKQHFAEPGPRSRWPAWVNDICSTWFASDPAAASAWFKALEQGPESERIAWIPRSQHIPLNEWSGPGSVIAVAESQINRPGFSVTSKGVVEALSEQITTSAEIAALQKMVEDKNVKWPARSVRSDGLISHKSAGSAPLQIATAYEKAWPRIDPEGWRAYAKEKVIGADSSHLLLQVTVEDCRRASDPLAIARQFMDSPHSAKVDSLEWAELARVLESRKPGSGLEILTNGKTVATALAMVQIAEEKSLGNLPATMEIVQQITDPNIRRRAMESALTKWSTDPEDAEKWMQAAAMASEETEAIREWQMSRPIFRTE